jgi:UDP-3-O-[3-hydroxymyristoyl] N-acetylglucosamine deacetylase
VPGGEPARVTLSGVGLHSGLPATITLSRESGPVVFRTPLGDARLDELDVVRADHGVRVRAERTGLDLDSVEHLIAALAGLSVRRGVVIAVDGAEVPLLDGGSLAFATALMALTPPRHAPALRVLTAGTVTVGASVYAFEPAPSVALEVEVAFDAAAIGVQRTAWDGTPEAFLSGVAWARTFGFRRDGAALLAMGRARGTDPRAVMVLRDDGTVEPPGEPARPSEFARHKLLDLVGDLGLFGGPPSGRLCATRPGHAATHRALSDALARGIVGRSDSPTPPSFEEHARTLPDTLRRS